MEECAGTRFLIFFVWFVIGLFETLICAVAQDKVCDSCIVSSSESSRDLLLYVTNRKALAAGGDSPPEPPFKTLITLLPITFSQLGLQLGVGCGKTLVFW